MWDRYLDLNPIYYLFDLCTCSILDQNQRENDLLFMKYLLINAIVKETTNKFYGAVCQELDNNLLGNCVITCVYTLIRSNKFYGTVAGD